MEFLRTIPIPVSSFSIGPVSKRDVLCASVMLEHKMEYATILAFDVKINADAKLKVGELGRAGLGWAGL
jgi:translation initiation factor 5B